MSRIARTSLLALAVMGARSGVPSVGPAPSIDLKRPAAISPTQLVGVASVIGGGEPLEWGGTRLAAGDVNGDGIGDFVIAAPGGTEDRPSRRGRLYVVFGSVAPARPVLDRTVHRLPAQGGGPPGLATQADMVIDGPDDFDHFGSSLLVADLDADGFADIVAGAPRADGPDNRRPDCGEVFVIRGAATMPRTIELSRPPAEGIRLHVIVGRAAGDALGAALGAGDLNGDGVMDLIAAAPLSGGTTGVQAAVNVGEVAVVRAGASLPAAPASIDLASPPADVVVCLLRGGDPGDQAGSALTTGDFDGDGLVDLAIGARGGDGPRNHRPDSGEVYLVFGSRILPRAVALGLQSDVFFAPADIGDLGGGSLAFGDVDGDGMADLAIGAEFADGLANGRLDAGEVILLKGRGRPALEGLRPAPPPGAASPPGTSGPVLVDLAEGGLSGVTTISGADPGDHTGARAVTDLDRDGRAELVIGAEDSSSRRNARAGGGELRIVRGAPSLPAVLDLSDDTAPTIHGAVGGGHFGKAAVAADMDGDNTPELIVSAPQAGQSLAGRIWVLKGDWRGWLGPIRPGRGETVR